AIPHPNLYCPRNENAAQQEAQVADGNGPANPENGAQRAGEAQAPAAEAATRAHLQPSNRRRRVGAEDPRREESGRTTASRASGSSGASRARSLRSCANMTRY